jgi:FMNH2-dependent dimethyl sulfone monooxygenase
VNGLWQSERFSFSGRYYEIDQGILEPGPVQQPRPTIYAGGESPAGKDLISRTCDGWLTHGDPPGVIGGKVAEMTRRRRGLGLEPMRYGAAGYAVVRPTEAEARAEVERITDVRQSARGYANYRDWIQNTKLERRVSVKDYSVSNRGLRSGLVGTPDQVADRIRAFGQAGVDLLLLQFSPQLEEMERFAEEVIPLVREDAVATTS